MIIDIFIPCFIDQLYPEIGFNMLKIFKKVGCEVHYNPNQTCCGQPAYNAGYWDEAREVAEKFIKDFSNDRPVVVPSGSCAGFVKKHYPELFYNTALHNECKQITKNLYEFTDFMVNILKITDIGAEFNSIVTYHDSCTALREYGIKDEPRELLKKVKNLQLREMKDSDVCCGFGGTFSVKFEPISIAMAEQKMQNALETGAEYLVLTEASCLMHLESYTKKQNLPIKPIHIINILACFPPSALGQAS